MVKYYIGERYRMDIIGREIVINTVLMREIATHNVRDVMYYWMEIIGTTTYIW